MKGNSVCTKGIALKIRLWNEYSNPYYWWWKVREYFVRPRIHLAHVGRITWFYGLPIKYDYYNRIIDVRLSGLGWKLKYQEVRHEWNPYLALTFFRKWQLIWVWDFTSGIKLLNDGDSTRSMATWEAILDIIINHKTVDQVVEEHRWLSHIGNNEHSITIIPNIQPKLRNKYKIQPHDQVVE